jgi:hypothetical protein
MENEFDDIRYFIQRASPSDVAAAVYRLRQRAGSHWQSHYWDWRASNWREEEDILRRYWTGFDADVDEVSEEDALGLIARLGGQGFPKP